MSALSVFLQEYRERVCSGIASYHGTSSGTKVPRKPRSAREPGSKRDTAKKKPIQSRSAGLEDACGTTPTVKRKKSATPYKDPMAGEKLEMITKIRAQRAALEIEKKEAIKRARYVCLFHSSIGWDQHFSTTGDFLATYFFLYCKFSPRAYKFF